MGGRGQKAAGIGLCALKAIKALANRPEAAAVTDVLK